MNLVQGQTWDPQSLIGHDSLPQAPSHVGLARQLWAIVVAFAIPISLKAQVVPYLTWNQVEQDYAPPREQVFEGKIRRVRFLRFMDPDPAVCADLVQKGAILRILIAPSSWLASKAVLLSSGLTLSGVGCARFSGPDTWVIAREITVQGKKLTVRDKGGRPSWLAGRRRTSRSGKGK